MRQKHGPAWYDYMPVSFVLPAQAQELIDALQQVTPDGQKKEQTYFFFLPLTGHSCLL
jgi:hypothetical protein